MVAPPKPFQKNPFVDIKNTNANWVAIIPFAFSEKGSPEIHFEELEWQWWGEQPDGIRESIRLAKESGFHIMLKPQVWMHNDWVGNVDYHSEVEWKKWETNYRKYLIQNVHMAIEMNVDLLCIATEYNIAVIKRAEFFRSLISEIRKIYKGKLCYSANWDHYSEIKIWDELDYIGINAYFPLNKDITPDTKHLKQAWQQIIPEMKSFSVLMNKKVLFTEFGYLSVDGCTGKSWEIEKQIDNYSINEIAQANAYEGMFSSLWNETWWAGGFVWKWFPNGEGHEGYPEKDYTPQGKEAEIILKHWYGNNQ